MARPPMSARAEERAAKREALSGAGPTPEGHEVARNPGATARFALFGEVLLVGLLITVVSLPLVTLPAALTAGIRHLRRFASAEESHARTFFRDLRRALPGGLVVGLIAVVATLVLLLDIDLARSGFLPGGPVIEAVGWAGLAATALVVLTSATLWTPEAGWRATIRATPRALAADPAGAAYLLATVVFAVVVTWVLLPLVVAALGCTALAAMAVPVRPRRRA
ncbi:hypothetical protein [Microbacterium sp. NPDC077184]|uniref:hypothetical protein n=1 Tax=Microbacterium sp. NPDC077184 TaxID=3154764 RepID=UPI00342444C8